MPRSRTLGRAAEPRSHRRPTQASATGERLDGPVDGARPGAVGAGAAVLGAEAAGAASRPVKRATVRKAPAAVAPPHEIVPAPVAGAAGVTDQAPVVPLMPE